MMNAADRLWSKVLNYWSRNKYHLSLGGVMAVGLLLAYFMDRGPR
jgi:hypothetical protein